MSVRLAAAIDALDALDELGPGRIPDHRLEELRRLRGTVRRRLELGEGATVVAVAGGTGVGKSALVNRLVGTDVVDEGVRRPTTDHPVGIVPAGSNRVGPLLDWLGVDDRREAPAALPDGLVLIDLPDHDSVVATHREVAARLAQRVDALLVVVDPVKYARADLHDGPLALLAHHAEVVRVVLNRADELRPADLDACLGDLRGRLTTTGHGDVEVLVTSAATGSGVDAVRRWVDELVHARTAATRRLLGDAAATATATLPDLPALPDLHADADRLLDVVLEATDAHRAEIAAEVAYRRTARRAGRSVLARAALLPLRQLVGAAQDVGVGSDTSPARTDRSGRSPVARVQTALADELELSATVGATHAALGSSIERLAADGAPALADAVDGAGLHPRRRGWWSLLSAVRGVCEAVTLVGAAWLGLLALADLLQLPEVGVPVVVGGLTWPTALALGGLLCRVAVGLLGRVATDRGARRHRATVHEAIRRRAEVALRERLLEPYVQEVARHRSVHEHLRRLAGAA